MVAYCRSSSILNAYAINSKKSIIEPQHFSMGDKLVTVKKYSVEIMIRAFECFPMPRATFNCLRENFQLPSVTTLTRLIPKVKSVYEDISTKSFFKLI